MSADAMPPLSRRRPLPTELRNSLFEALADQLDLGNTTPELVLEGLERALDADPGARRAAARVRDWRGTLRAGDRLADTLALELPPVQRIALKAAAASGLLSRALRSVLRADTVIADMRGQIRKALIQPAYHIGLLWGVLVLFQTWLIPSLQGALGGRDVEPSLMASVFVDLAAWSVDPFGAPFTLLLLAAVYLAIPPVLQTGLPPRRLRRLLTAVPPGSFASLRARLALLDTLAMLLAVGVEPAQALESIAKSSRPWMRGLLADAAARIRDGEKLHQALRDTLEPRECVWLEIHGRGHSVSDAVERCARTYQKLAEKRLAATARTVNAAGTLLVVAVLFTCILGVLSMLGDVGTAALDRF